MKKSKGALRVGIAAVVAAGVAVFFARTQKGKKFIAQGRAHATELAKMIAQKAETITNLSKGVYDELVDEVILDYQKQKKLTQRSAKSIADMLKAQWTDVKKEFKK